MKIVTATQAAYMAGIVDGEGNISLAQKTNKRGINFTYATDVSVTNTKIDLLTYLGVTTGLGYIAPCSTNPKWKDRWRWSLRVDDIIPFLETVMPYLVIKQLHASLMLEFLNQRRKPSINAPLTDSEICLRSVIFQELAELNKSGI